MAGSDPLRTGRFTARCSRRNLRMRRAVRIGSTTRRIFRKPRRELRSPVPPHSHSSLPAIFHYWSSLIRNRRTQDGLPVHAVAGTYVAMLAFDFPKEDCTDCLDSPFIDSILQTRRSAAIWRVPRHFKRRIPATQTVHGSPPKIIRFKVLSGLAIAPCQVVSTRTRSPRSKAHPRSLCQMRARPSPSERVRSAACTTSTSTAALREARRTFGGLETSDRIKRRIERRPPGCRAVSTKRSKST